ncbi:unnamed protein product [Moneuplotes crassus]|uniref:Uncharacterized protein n=1 Tax=Euplotes crassus TaxID=5936 RepID=A0AAD1XUR8_EUPCR|nr:unnamed protein product [Moneuplotes crassus]
MLPKNLKKELLEMVEKTMMSDSSPNEKANPVPSELSDTFSSDLKPQPKSLSQEPKSPKTVPKKPETPKSIPKKPKSPKKSKSPKTTPTKPIKRTLPAPLISRLHQLFSLPTRGRGFRIKPNKNSRAAYCKPTSKYLKAFQDFISDMNQTWHHNLKQWCVSHKPQEARNDLSFSRKSQEDYRENVLVLENPEILLKPSLNTADEGNDSEMVGSDEAEDTSRGLNRPCRSQIVKIGFIQTQK